MFWNQWKLVCYCSRTNVVTQRKSDLTECRGCGRFLTEQHAGHIWMYDRKKDDGTWELKNTERKST